MLTVQPVSMNTNFQKVSFQRNDRQAFEDDREFFEQQKREIENLIDDNRLPGGMKKFLKVANVVTDALIAGFTVACATIASATCGKNTFNKLAGNKMVKSAVEGFGPMGEYASKSFKTMKHYAADFVRKIFGKEKGQKIVNFAKNVIKTVEKFFKKLNPFKSEESFDKATTKTAAGLGVGAGAASAYAKAVEKSEQESGEE